MLSIRLIRTGPIRLPSLPVIIPSLGTLIPGCVADRAVIDGASNRSSRPRKRVRRRPV